MVHKISFDSFYKPTLSKNECIVEFLNLHMQTTVEPMCQEI